MSLLTLLSFGKRKKQQPRDKKIYKKMYYVIRKILYLKTNIH